MKVIVCIIIGYLLGSINPAHFLEKIKKENFRKQGTGNLGATNTMIILGKKYGALVMVFDVLKSFFAVRIAKAFLPMMPAVWLLSGAFAVAGHVFPFYLKFRGGKGLAAFGGVVLGYDIFSFVILLIISIVLMLLFDYGTAMPVSASILFPFFVLMRGGNALCFFISLLLGGLVFLKHFSNLQKAFRGEDTRVREYIERYIK